MSREEQKLDRREFLRTTGRTIAGAALAVGGLSRMVEGVPYGENSDDLDKYDFIMPRVKYIHQKKEVDRWDVRPGGDANLLEEFSSVIRCKVKPVRDTNDWKPQYAEQDQLNAVVTFEESEEVRKYPFLFITGENHYEFTAKEKVNLKEYIMRGGFLYMDDCVVGNGGDFFYKSSFKLLEEVFGNGAVKRVPHEHEIFHNVYDLGDTGLPYLEYVKKRRRKGKGLPYMHGQNHGARGIFAGNRLAIFLTSTDIHCGWCDSHGFTWGKENYKKAIQMGINIIMYAISH
ncbi:MAG: DUF4159 domain-containing protein [Planctomycetota bacterium]|jgi:hypothetical protein